MKPLVIANWKMNPKTLGEAKRLLDSIKKGIKKQHKAEIVICPPFTYLSFLQPKIGSLHLGAQNCFWEMEGAYTGEVSALMIKAMKCKYAILGHSERRKYFFETDEQINKKVKSVLNVGLNPVLCIGETGQEKKKGETGKVLKLQIKNGLKGIAKNQLSKISIAYEPVWAIGTGNSCDIEESKKVKEFILTQLPLKLKILYGGSVDSKNSESYLKQAGFNGLLIGGASLKSKEFLSILSLIN